MHQQVFIDTVGHCAGLVLFGLLTVLFWRNKPLENTRRGQLSCLAAFLVFLWNGAELLLLAQPPLPASMLVLIVAISLLCLNFLPAVLLQLALDRRLYGVGLLGYLLSSASLLFDYTSLNAGGLRRPQASLLLLSVGFVVLGAAAWLWLEYSEARHKPRGHRSSRIAFLSLLIFATSFLHFQPGHTARIWVGEAIWHHAAIPIALVVLLSDYRFLLLDTFLRFAVGAAWTALWLWALATLAVRFRLVGINSGSSFTQGLLVTVLCLVIYVVARSLRPLQSIATTIAFRRPSLNVLLQALRELGGQPEPMLLQAATQEIGSHYNCKHSAVIPARQIPAEYTSPLLISVPDSEIESLPDWTVVLIPLRFSRGDSFCICLGPRHGSRRFLSEDLTGLQRAQTVLLEVVERLRREQLERLAQEAELKALQAQINPHFLFNALNTLYGTIGRGSPEARQLVLNLADVFRYRLQGNRKYVALSEELEIVRAYLEIEALRLGPRLTTKMHIDERLHAVSIPILSIQPLVENAVKHGVSDTGEIFIQLTISASEDGVRVAVEDKGPGFGASKPSNGTGSGLTNVHQRLSLCYGTDCGLQYESSTGGARVWFTIPENLLPLI